MSKKELKEIGLDSNCNSVFSLNYHIIICVKYRKNAFRNELIAERCKDIIKESSKENNVDILGIDCGYDHIHILCRTTPNFNIPNYLNIIKGRTSRILRRDFPELKEILWGEHFWSPSYYIATAGNVSLDTLKNYVENQRAKEEEETLV